MVFLPNPFIQSNASAFPSNETFEAILMIGARFPNFATALFSQCQSLG
jgi:hypothetical protein